VEGLDEIIAPQSWFLKPHYGNMGLEHIESSLPSHLTHLSKGEFFKRGFILDTHVHEITDLTPFEHIKYLQHTLEYHSLHIISINLISQFDNVF